MLNANELLKEGIKQVKDAGIEPGHINPEVKINYKAKLEFGRCSKTPGEYDYEIQLNSELLNAEKHKVMDTIVHEVLHSVKGCMNHGSKWQKNVAIVNEMYGYDISRTSSFEKAGIKEPTAKYIIECQDCNVEIKRYKWSKLVRETDKYRCGCGGKLVRTK